jgi:hypothetical protein
MWVSIVRITFSTTALTRPVDILSFSISAIFAVSMVQNSVSVEVVGVVLNDERVRILLS